MIICPSCNAPNEDGAGFCDQCGHNLAGLSAASSIPAAAPGIAAPSAGNGCPSCGAAVIPGEAFCDACGAALGGTSVAPPPIAPPVMQSPVMSPPVVTPPLPPPVGIPSPVTTARIVLHNGQSVTLAGKTSYLIGREDPVSGIFPEVDTTPSGGDEAGVSRRHAEIIQQGAQWFVQALNTTNPTFVNQQRVAPNARLPLNPGDQIRLGKWVATFQVA